MDPYFELGMEGLTMELLELKDKLSNGGGKL